MWGRTLISNGRRSFRGSRQNGLLDRHQCPFGDTEGGIETIRRRDPIQTELLDTWLETVIASFGNRILPVTLPIADRFARLCVPDRLPFVDGLLAATALVHDIVLVTRNVRDVARTGARLLDPFAPSEGT